MTRILILLSLGAVINTAFLPSYLDYSRGLERLFGNKREAAQKKERSLCDTKECELIANVIKNSLDESVDPCDDFYEYACGRWSNINPRPENKTTWSLWDMVEEKVENQVKGIIQNDPKPTDLFAVKLAKLWYKSCMDEEAAERRGVEPILSVMWRFGGWPLIMEDGEWDDNIYTWQFVDDSYARVVFTNALHDLQYGRFYYEANDTIILGIPHLLPEVYSLLPDGSRYSSSDDSDENNESGEGSQENGSKEKRPRKGEDDEGDEEEENNEDDNENVMVRRKVHRKLGRSRSNGNSEGLTKIRTKRDILKDKVLRGMRKQRKHATHGVHHSGKKTKEVSDKKKQGKRKSHKRLHGKTNNKRTKMTEENDVDEKTKKSKNTPTKTRVHNTKQQRDHVARRTRVSKRADEDESPNTDDVENEDSSDNEVPTEDNDEEQDNGSANEDDDEENDKVEDSDAEDDEEDEDDEDDPEEEERERLQRIEKYKDYVFNVSLLLSRERGVEVSHEKMKKSIEDMVDFAIKLGEITLMDAMEPDESTIDDFQELYDNLPSRTSNSKVNWRKKVEKLLEEAGITLDGDVEMILFPNYFKRIVGLLDETSGETIVNYIHWHFVSKIGPITIKEIEEVYHNGYGTGAFSSREELCIQQVELGDIVGYQFVEEHFSEEIAQTARDMIDDIQKEVEYQIKEATWMDEDTEHFILDKLVNMKNLVGYPEWYKNTTLVKRYFRGLTVGPSHFENVLNYLKYRKLKELRQSLEEEMNLNVNPLMLNAFFMPDANTIAITAADFQSPFFALNRPWNINYGVIGVVMGHEVNHGFDDSGRLYDRKGKPMEWLSAMAAAYDKRAMCFVDQFNKYPLVKGKNVTFEDYGNRTAGENIADTMGLQAVFRAYQRRERECARPDPALPGLEKFSNEQTFFLSFANVWCESEDPEYAVMQAKYDVHSSGRIRVIGSVSNSDDFARAFNCPVGSPMNPEKKCNIWV
ncbi:membrane metallo-endopeptidase-like 1 [Hylaeus anthracinus]|uniref:membrane metallo-endopeptidase-like 1 n=1 Tax=Hylaeus anthracinus TaxID=313031 RepID=UPI0023B94837|nr:membrane metallo-endopeptidase-like 1 [Hylaeus anthracinus]